METIYSTFISNTTHLLAIKTQGRNLPNIDIKPAVLSYISSTYPALQTRPLTPHLWLLFAQLPSKAKPTVVFPSYEQTKKRLLQTREMPQKLFLQPFPNRNKSHKNF